MLAKDASKKDIFELKQRLNERQEQRVLDRDTKQVIDIVNRRSNEVKRGSTKGPFYFSSDKV